MPITFDDEEEAYRSWLAAHPAGYVVNRRRKKDPTYLKLHRAVCPHIGNDPPGNFTTHAYLKVCSLDLARLEAWARATHKAELDAGCFCNGAPVPRPTQDRLVHLRRFYELLGLLESKVGGHRTLIRCSGSSGWPDRGVYFFFEEGELRSDSGQGLRVTRVGTHALKAGGKTKLWNRLSNHARPSGGGLNHRASVFRLLVGTAIAKREPVLAVPSWGKNGATRTESAAERPLEDRVNAVIGAMPFLWLAVNDAPGPDSLRGVIERNSIALLSNLRRPSLDAPSARWLGHDCSKPKVRGSGLWNRQHADEDYDPGFLDTLAELVEAVE